MHGRGVSDIGGLDHRTVFAQAEQFIDERKGVGSRFAFAVIGMIDDDASPRPMEHAQRFPRPFPGTLP